MDGSNRLRLCVFLVAIPMVSTGISAQTTSASNSQPQLSSTQTSAEGAQAPRQRRTVVDGATNPEFISDEMTIGLLMSMWTIPPNADDGLERRLKERTSGLKLSASDYQVLRRELMRGYSQFESTRRALSQAKGRAAASIQQDRVKAIANDVYGRTLEFMSADGRQKLKAHIADAKTRVTITTLTR